MSNFFSNPLVIACACWLIAQFIKMIDVLVREKRFDMLFFARSGGMPSAHSALVCALAMAVAMHDGISSITFAISAVLALIVMYDAAGVRQAVGKQAVTINRIIRHTADRDGRPHNLQQEIKVLMGHTPVQVYLGAALGILVTFIWLTIMGYSLHI